MPNKKLSCGKDLFSVPDVATAMKITCAEGFDFVCLPLFHPRNKREFVSGPSINRQEPVTRSDVVLSSTDWGSLVVAKVSPWINVESPITEIRRNSEMALKEELSFANHLAVPAILIQLQSLDCCNTARMVYTHILAGFSHMFWIQVPLVAPQLQLDGVFNEDDENKDVMVEPEYDTWKWWNRFNTMCDTHRRLGLVLELTPDLPGPEDIERWCGEPVKALILPTNLFLTNKSGFPVLSKGHQSCIKRFLNLEIQMVITGVCRHPDKGFKCYKQYLDNLFMTREAPDKVQQFAQGYEDYLQCPLQPLMDNLESATYEIFERDPIKYTQYQKAVFDALIDRVPEDEIETNIQVVMVLGAGRGPLVTASLRAAKQSCRKIHVYAVEKNPNAVITLLNWKEEEWKDKVTVVRSDMRVWQAPQKADIIVSELLGSFGDNELSPECLDGAQKFLKDDGISIPCEYTSYIAPLSSSKLWNEARCAKDMGKIYEASYETPYVVRFHNVNILTEAKPLFTFKHPNKGVIDNNRHGRLDFHISPDALVHGFAGYFHCVLYKDTTISIVPESHSPGMFSWFPIYFPLKEPVYVKNDQVLTLEFWRVCSEKNVWYEWCVTAPYTRNIHNPKGRSYTIGL